ncbi:ribosomal protein S18-alanine N-acetyltransferase [Aestuariibacter salexigens]|uniref:ribosomal protein S18-alanine N-acetyltransferase n=1 Tax=Aestuariibacter salexigens TaxID=226010 RepID=UPI000425661A|nr:ribosomal protein S18-alanine N-acetyltransferase [Aestuariibacter salexigens]
MSNRLVALNDDNAARAYQIHRDGHPVPWSAGVFSSCLTGQYFAFALYEADNMLGYFIGLQVLDELTLMDIAVKPEWRGMGKGSALLESFLTQCTLRNASKVWLEVRSSNVAAIELYKHAGFKVQEIRKGYYQRNDKAEDAIVMCLSLAHDAS